MKTTFSTPLDPPLAKGVQGRTGEKGIENKAII
jgi:hypothetical protein